MAASPWGDAAPPWWQRLKRWIGVAAPADSMPATGTPQAAAAQGAWVLAWASRASPVHANQDCAGARWLAPLPSGPGRSGSEGAVGVALAVADGVTHGAAGHVAALALVQHWLTAAHDLPEPQRRFFLTQADAAVTEAIGHLGSQPGAATGAAAWLGPQGQGWVTRVGDCRLLHGRPPASTQDPGGWALRACLPDQTYRQIYPEWFRPDVASPLHPEQPAYMAGGGRLGEPESLALTLDPGDLLLLCSDGLHSAVPLPQMAGLLARHLPPGEAGDIGTAVALQRAAQAAADDLIQTAAVQGSDDDITVLLALRRRPPPHRTPP